MYIIKLKHIAIACVVIDVLSIPKGNTGGHIAHLGGAIFGYIYIKQQKSNNVSTWFSNLLSRIVNSYKTKNTIYKRPKTDRQWGKEKAKNQKEIDSILEKISQSGYESLSKNEKSILFNASKK